ncbi:MAG: hypothetical protein RXQ70_01820 [Sulfolobaceae archaeon]|nr:hypothetical protein [Sulfolobales archaeon]
MRLPAGSGKFIVQAVVGVGMLLASFWLTLYGEVMSYGLGYFFATAALAIAGAVVGLRGALEFVKLVIEELELRKMRE